MYHHVAHLDSFEPGVNVGLRFKKGDLLGRCGKTGTTSPHCHYEIMREKPERWTQYVNGMGKEEVKARYADPEGYATPELPMKWNSLGYGYLASIAGGGFHPGLDLNFGSGSDDFRFEVRATTDGVIEYVGLNPKDGNWGNHIWWKEISNMGENLEGHLIWEGEKSGSFALVQKGKKRVITDDRSGLAALYAYGNKPPYKRVTKAEWDSIPSGDNF